MSRDIASAFILKATAALFTFLLNVSIARLLGAEDAGLYYLAFSVSIIGSVIARVGLDNSMLRFISTHSTLSNYDTVNAVYLLGIKIALIAATLVTIVLFFLAPWISYSLFDKPELASPLQWMALSILPSALLYLHAECLKGLKEIRFAMFIQGVGLPLAMLIMIYPLIRVAGVMGAVFAYNIACFIIAAAGFRLWRKSKKSDGVAAFSFMELWESCRPLLIASIFSHAIIPYSPLFFLGIWASSKEAGLFAIASQVAPLASFFLMTANNVVAPKFAELFALGDLESAAKLARRTSSTITLLASPVFLLLLFGSEWVMNLFGSGFSQGALLLSILTIGQIINLVTGSVGYLLMMSGNEQSFRNLTVFSGALLMAGSVLLIPSMGAVGAAIASSISLASLNIAAAWLVYKKLGIRAVGWQS